MTTTLKTDQDIDGRLGKAKETMEEAAVFRTLLLVILHTCVIQSGYSAWLPNVCVNVTSAPSGQPNKPDIPMQWRAKVECKILGHNMTVFVEQYYDYSENRARVRQMDKLESGDLYYDYGNNEILTVNRLSDPGNCQVLDLDHDPNKFMFGVKRDAAGRTHVLSPSGALHFDDDFNWVFQSRREIVRGIAAESWSTCQYSPVLDATMSVTWYFSVKTEWDMQLGVRSVPLRANVTGKLNDPLKGVREFHNLYDIFDFDVSVSPDDFQLQPGDYCEGRVVTKPFPGLPNIFSIVGEILDSDHMVLKTIEEFYDNQRRLNVYRYKDKDSLGLLVGAAKKIEVNDFNEGYAYMMDRAAGTCRVGLIEDGDFGYVYGTATSVRQQTPAEFFLTTNVTWEYSGVKTVRGITCDTWTGETSNMQGYPNQTVRIEWAFASTTQGAMSNYHDWNTGISTVPIPVSSRIWKSGSTGSNQVNYQYNAYAFTQLDQPFYSIIDLSSCFQGSERVNVRFRVDNTYQSAVVNNPMAFRTALTNTIQLFLGISPLRVADILIEERPNDIAVSFNLLDKPVFAGDTGGIGQNSLSAAVSLLTSPFIYNSFQVDVVVGTNVVLVKPMNESVSFLFANGSCMGGCEAVDSSGSGYTGGALAGLAIGMLIVGSAAGTLGGHFAFNRRRGSWSTAHPVVG